MNRPPGTNIMCYQCGHEWKNKFKHVPFCPSCKHVGFNWRQEPDLDGEEWRNCTLLGKHEISNYGRLKSTITGNAIYVGKIIKGGIDRCGYIRYQGTKGPLFAHILVAHEFIGLKPEGYQCNHRDGNKLNNHVDNMEYLTPRDHVEHTKKNDLIAYGERSARAKLKESDIASILFLRERGRTHKNIAELFNVDESNISCIARGITWKRSREKYESQAG